MEVEGLLKVLNFPIHSVRIYGRNNEIPIIANCEPLAIGAEAKLFKCLFLGVPAVIKIRNPKPFLHPQVDAKLRSRRTRIEAKALVSAASLGIRVPRVLWVDLEGGVIIMEFIDGEPLRDVLRRVGDEEACRYVETLGEYLSLLHSAGIVHGDPTTANALVPSDGSMYLIDFGLAEFTKMIDEYAIDLHIAFRAIESTHFDREELLKKCLVEGYSKHAKDVNLVLKRVSEIRLMGRYVEKRRKSVWAELR